MSENNIPKIEPIKLKEFDTKQSKYYMVHRFHSEVFY